jgi:hypothetical protein
MKRFATILKKGFIIITLIAGTAVVLESIGWKTQNEAKAAIRPGQVRYYLECKGYEVISLNQMPNSENYEAQTILNGVSYVTTVYVRDGQIIDHEDAGY